MADLLSTGSRPSVTILVVDDIIGMVGGLQQKAFLRNYEQLPFTFVFETCQVGGGFDPARAVEALERESDVRLVLLDLQFGDPGTLLGLDILRRLTLRFPSIPVLVMSALERDVDLLGRCLEDGAVGFVEKNRSPEYLRSAIDAAIDLMQSNVLLGQNPQLRELRRQAARLSPYDQIPVLIVGERGTGKERVARYIHQNGPRRQGPFIAVNCAGVPETLFEAEFFGAEKGAYTGAQSRRLGYFERAHGGTLFLDEIGTLPVPMQAKLLRVLQDRRFGRLGSSGEDLVSNFQLLSATNIEPQQLVSEGKLREDFLDRIAAVTIHTPALRDCRSDLPLLANHFLDRLVHGSKRFAKPALNALTSHDWPGNVRELQRVVQEAVVRSEGAAIITTSHLPRQLSAAGPAQSGASRDTAFQSEHWNRRVLLAELEVLVEAKRAVRKYKGNQWKAEFMRVVYPHCRTHSAKGFSDLMKRLSSSPWGDPSYAKDPKLARLYRELES